MKKFIIPRLSILWFLVLILMSALVVLYFWQRHDELDAPARGRIIFHVQADGPQGHFYVMDANGGHLWDLGKKFTGSAAWSRDGKWVAIGCENPDFICILETATFFDAPSFDGFTYPPKQHFYGIEPAKQFPLPDFCKTIKLEDRVIDFAWSPTGDRLALSCQGSSSPETRQGQVCIQAMNGPQNCWDYRQWDYSIYHVAWSPHEDVLAITIEGPDQGPKVLLDDTTGKHPRILADGWSAEWSPDGKFFAYMRHSDAWYDWRAGQLKTTDPDIRSGLALMNLNGQFLRWLIAPMEHVSSGETQAFPEHLLYFIGFDRCWGRGGFCRLTWSPDARYIMFTADYGGDGNFQQLMRYDMWTQEVTLPFPFSPYCGPPAWGNYP